MRTASPKGAKGKADRLFSQLVRERGACQKCGKVSHLQCAHVISRRYSATRVVRDNAWCLCAGCHLEVDTHAGVKMRFVAETIGLARYWELYRLAQAGAKVDWVEEAARLQGLVAA